MKMNNDDITKELVNLFKQCLSNPVFMRNFQLLLETPLEQKNIKSEIMDAAYKTEYRRFLGAGYIKKLPAFL